MNRTDERNKRLGESFRQARRETLVIVAAWAVFLAWSGLVCGFGARLDSDEPLRTAFGMPRWAFFGVVLPWLAACLFTTWFALKFMQDTDLDPDRARPEEDK